MKNVNYAFTTDQGNLVFRSSVNSFGLDHVTDKDIASFYTTFSQSAYFDTGLLPVDGTGLLSIRTAGNHTQIAYQYAPGKYYINWGSFEGDRDAKKYYVAQDKPPGELESWDTCQTYFSCHRVRQYMQDNNCGNVCAKCLMEGDKQ
jgi:hypothetical protein